MKKQLLPYLLLALLGMGLIAFVLDVSPDSASVQLAQEAESAVLD